MATYSGRPGLATGLIGRLSELQALDQVVNAVRAGESQVLVMRGEPGVGKSVLLDYLAGRASDAACLVTRATGVQSEMELAFAGLHQLCVPMLGHAERLPGPQRDALRTAFGLTAGPPPDRFLVGLAVLSLLSEAAGNRPLIGVIDDVQWLDRASAQAFGFTARRLAADPVGLVFAARDPADELAGLPELEVGGLPDRDARTLLEGALAGPLDARVRDLIIAETHGNPLALLELPRGLTPAELAGGFGLPGAVALTDRIEDSFTRQLDALPADTLQLVQLAAADPSGDQSLVWRAAGTLGISARAAAAPAVAAGLIEFGTQVQFRHPLARSAAYRSASLSDRQRMHAALAEMTDPVADPDRRAWHRAQAAAGPDEEVAAELERCAGRAQARGGLAAAAAFLERSVALTVDAARHAERVLAAAQASLQAGEFDKALELLATAEAGPLDEFQRARAGLLRGRLSFASGPSSDAPVLLLNAAQQLEPFDLQLARETYVIAWAAAGITAHLDGGALLLRISRAVRNLPASGGSPRPLELLLDGFALVNTEGHAAAIPAMQRAAKAMADISVQDVLRWGWLASGPSYAVWDIEGAVAISARKVELLRDAGVLAQLPIPLSALAITIAWVGDLAGVAALIAESDHVAAVTGTQLAPYARLRLLALQGIQAQAGTVITSAIEHRHTHAQWAAAVLYNGLARYEEAAAAAQHVASNTWLPWLPMWALPELVEAAARSGNAGLARDALERLAATTRPCGTDWALGIEARCRALLSDAEAADELYREAIGRLSRTRLRPELARAHLLYGEWLRRQGRRTDAREQLRAAHDMLAAIGMEAFAERARRELAATGEAVRRRDVESTTTLTAQEAHIARLARDGRTNPEIGAVLFLSSRTIEWHLRNIYAKLGIGSRRELHAALAQLGPEGISGAGG